MIKPTIAVTGATGNLGGGVARRLAAAGAPQRQVVREARRAPDLAGAEIVEASYEDITSMTDALRGIETLLLVSGHEGQRRVALHAGAIDAAKHAGVGRVVYTSFLAASPQATFTYARDHYETEEILKASGLAYTFLRASFYLDYVANWASPEGILRGPAGDGRIAWVARDDLADVAATVLTSPGHAGKTYDVTGGRLLTLAETAAELTSITGKTYRFENETIEEAYASRSSYNPPQWELDAWVGTYLAIALGEMAIISDSVSSLTGHAPRDLGDLYGAPLD